MADATEAVARRTREAARSAEIVAIRNVALTIITRALEAATSAEVAVMKARQSLQQNDVTLALEAATAAENTAVIADSIEVHAVALELADLARAAEEAKRKAKEAAKRTRDLAARTARRIRMTAMAREVERRATLAASSRDGPFEETIITIDDSVESASANTPREAVRTPPAILPPREMRLILERTTAPHLSVDNDAAG